MRFNWKSLVIVFYALFVCSRKIHHKSVPLLLHVLRPNYLQYFGQNFFFFPSWYSQSPLLTVYTPPPPPPTLSKSCLKLVCNVNIVYRNLKSENSQDYAQKPQRNCTFMNSATVEAKTERLYSVQYLVHCTITASSPFCKSLLSL